MRLTVRHVTRYRFAAPVRGAVQSHRLIPADCEGQTILDWRVEVEGAHWGAAFRDGAGDQVRTMVLRGPVSEIEVAITGEVETTDTAGVLRGHREAVPPLAYRRTTRLTRPDKPIAELARAALEGREDAADLDRAHALAAAVADAIAYAPGETHASTTAAEALAQGAGVCQDHAQVLIAAASVAGLPARYVTGYLNATEDGTPHEASHAWAELHVEGLGWVGFDPANKCCTNEHYIRVGSGLDAEDAAPIRGLILGGGAEELDVRVAVEAAQQ
jgi:transglutaminase-like putative cysteine protease